MVDANRLLYESPVPGANGKTAKGKHPDHIAATKYIPAVKDSKRATDEYYSGVFCGGKQTINIFNECEDSLLTTPLILDLTILVELLTRVRYHKGSTGQADFALLYPVLSLLFYMCKAPLVKPGTDVVNSLGRQHNAFDVFLRACIGLEGNSGLLLETRI